MRIMLGLVAAMGVLIAAGVVVVVATILHRAAGPAALRTQAVLAEPPGTRMVNLAATGGGLAVLLQGGGADRIVFIDPVHQVVVGRVALGKQNAR